MRLAFAGQSRAGKDTAIDYLMTLVDKPMKLHIAEGVYSTARFMTGQQVIDNKDPAMRKLLQEIGSAGRNFSSDFWLRKLEEEIYQVTYQGCKEIFITGVRYPNEVHRLRELGFRVIYVMRSVGHRLDEGASHLDYHSENSLDADHFPYEDIIVNNGTLEEFKEALKSRVLNDKIRVPTSPV